MPDSLATAAGTGGFCLWTRRNSGRRRPRAAAPRGLLASASASRRLVPKMPKLRDSASKQQPSSDSIPVVPETTTLWRPVGQAELDLLAESDWRHFPPRRPGQPIFYPVRNEEYATKIARAWNTEDAGSSFAGYVVRFEVDAAYLARFEPERVGGHGIDELSVPAEDLDQFNAHIIGRIELVTEYR
jgi:hypothetical protein